MLSIKQSHLPRLELLRAQYDGSDEHKREVEEAVGRMKSEIDASYKRPEGVYSRIRKMAIQPPGDDFVSLEVNKRVRMTQEQYHASNMALRAIVEAKNSKQTVFAFSYITRMVEELRERAAFADVFFLLQLACGARCIEILDERCSIFTASEKSSNSIIQTGFAKKGPDSADASIEKPLLWTTRGRFLSDLKIVRDEVKKRQLGSRQAITKSFHTQLVNRARHLWPQNLVNGRRTGTHINRSIYANVAYHFYGSPSESLTHFIKHKLGHDSMGSAAHYMNVGIAFDGHPSLEEEAERQEGGFEREGVTFQNEEGGSVFIECPQIRRLSGNARVALVCSYASKLRAAGIPVTRQNLLVIGFRASDVRASKCV